MKHYQMHVEVHCPKKYMAAQKLKLTSGALIAAVKEYFQFKLDEIEVESCLTEREGPIEYSIRVVINPTSDKGESQVND